AASWAFVLALAASQAPSAWAQKAEGTARRGQTEKAKIESRSSKAYLEETPYPGYLGTSPLAVKRAQKETARAIQRLSELPIAAPMAERIAALTPAAPQTKPEVAGGMTVELYREPGKPAVVRARADGAENWRVIVDERESSPGALFELAGKKMS